MFGENTGAYAANESMEISKLAQEATLKQKLSYNVQQAEQKLKDAKRAQEILDNNPELEELINIMQRQRYL